MSASVSRAPAGTDTEPDWLNPRVVSGRQTFVIVGAGLAGGAAASTLRDEGFDGRIVMIGSEPHPPYERPPLSKEYLRGEQDFEAGFLRPPAWYQQQAVELVLETRADRIDPKDQAVVLGDGHSVAFDAVLVATGGSNRKLPVPGAGLGGILDLRTIEDADRIRAHARAGTKAVVVGAGFIGCEVAASLRQMGLEVDVVEVFDLPLLRVIGPEVGRVFREIHEEQGVRFHFERTVERFEGAGRVEAVVTSRGERIACDVVVVGVGIEPATDVVEGTAVEVRNGILVDERCHASVPGVYAAGDVANHWHPLFGRRMRVEHFDNALKQGAAAARSMIGEEIEYDDPHWFWSDQFEHNLQCMGHAPAWDEFVVRGSIAERNFIGFFVRDGVVDAVVGLNRGRDVRRSRALIRARRPVDPSELRDEDVDLRKLGAEPQG
jgi:3-phenylpropionate/trans-cinnamate dioxygenase ferredoxin reductase component